MNPLNSRPSVPLLAASTKPFSSFRRGRGTKTARNSSLLLCVCVSKIFHRRAECQPNIFPETFFGNSKAKKNFLKQFLAEKIEKKGK